jgi:putative transposase
MDRYLDQASTGPLYLRQQELACMVVQCLHKGAELGHYELAAFELAAFVVIASHVHVLLLPKVNPSRLLQSLKGFSAREANRMLGRTGEPFWQAESYDHWVRDEQEYARITEYMKAIPSRQGW